jgi:hypothetical protein
MESESGGCYSIVYISTAIVDFREAALLQLLKQSRGFNERAGITGVLMYGGGRFVQVLEGCPAAVRCLYARIAADPRHGRLEKLADGLLPRRDFAEWYMSFAPLPTGLDWQRVPGYLTPPQLVLAGLGTSAQPLLSEFLEVSSCLTLI